jgi:hypothetical protein
MYGTYFHDTDIEWCVGFLQSLATEAMKQCDEALNASSLQYICQQ